MQKAQNQDAVRSQITYNRPQLLEEILESYTEFEKMRVEHPVIYSEEMRMWQVFRYEDVSQAITNHADFSSTIMGASDVSVLKDTLVATDPPDHRKLRNLVNLAFTPKSVARLAGRITEITQELLNEVLPHGKMDIVPDIAFPLPAKVIAEMIGVPGEDWDIFKRWALIGDTEGRVQDDGTTELTLKQELSLYFADLLQQRRKTPREDLITSLSNAQIDGEQLSDREIIDFCILLLLAGQETTKNLIANAILCFTDHPDAMQKLIREPALMPAAIEEVVRYLPPAWFVLRLTTKEIELSGQRIPAHKPVMAWLAAANRDPEQFPDPNRFDIQRTPNRHIGFGHGIHFCVGAPLARVEAQIVLPMLLQQLKGLQRVKDVPIKVSRGLVFIIRNLPVTFDAV
jgi:cytochrome P450 family 109